MLSTLRSCALRRVVLYKPAASHKQSTYIIPTIKLTLRTRTYSTKMQTYHAVSTYRAWRYSLPPTSTVGVVPTMGALHAGHISLARAAASENTHVVVTIFLNPAQFSPTEDLASYPKTLEKDLEKLEELNASLPDDVPGRVSAVFVPTVAEMYPAGIPLVRDQQVGTFVEVIPLSAKLEGGTRPHFFRGVATVCTKLFNITNPNRVYFGQKDVQQTVIIRRLLLDLLFDIELRVIPTEREKDGLAMSSRNVYLKGRRREVAIVIYKALKAVEEMYNGGENRASVLLKKAREVVDNAGSEVKLDYVSLNEPHLLEEVDVVEKGKGVILSAAMWVLPREEEEGTVRLIDNLVLS
ncbi:pantothenate synthase, variant 2 [Orbilia oligospora]|uniref:Pantoate--beta-alanine ligase n=2 Tax=Orbilia oligospora TaxID=2813651 RepID=A0A7C8V716_ORBOL|nr:pantothenate synthase, variant 2 [Orbilia oligospora]